MQEGEVGHTIILKVTENGAPVNVTGATGITFYCAPPTGATKTFSGSIYNGPLGQFSYTTQNATDFNLEGIWQIQVEFTLGAWSGRSATVPLRVQSNL